MERPITAGGLRVIVIAFDKKFSRIWDGNFIVFGAPIGFVIGLAKLIGYASASEQIELCAVSVSSAAEGVDKSADSAGQSRAVNSLTSARPASPRARARKPFCASPLNRRAVSVLNFVSTSSE